MHCTSCLWSLLQATITVNVNKKAEVGQMVSFSDGMWISFKSDSTIRLFHTTSFNHMQDIDIASPIRRVLCKYNLVYDNKCGVQFVQRIDVCMYDIPVFSSYSKDR